MPSSPPRARIRGGGSPHNPPYPLGEPPDDVIREIGRLIIHRLAVGQTDISGDDFGTIFAAAIGGTHRASPVGIADVLFERNSWSAKTVQAKEPFRGKRQRFISGRNNPEFSFNIKRSEDIEKVGEAVLRIWNERVQMARSESDEQRVAVLLRDMQNLRFLFFEEEIQTYVPQDYTWSINRRNNLEGRNAATGDHTFTWQVSGGQFTIIRRVPASGVLFSLRRPSPVPEASVLRAVGYEKDWVRVLGRGEG